MERSKFDLWVGVFVMLGIASIVFLALRVGNLVSFSFEKTYPVQAVFSNIGGVSTGAPVKSAGVVVGRVRGISLDETGHQAVVAIDMESRYAFPQDSSMKVMTSGLLGEEFIAIIPGIDGQTLEEAVGKSAAPLLLTRTSPSVSIGEAISQIMPGADGNQPLVGETYFIKARFTNLGTIKVGSTVKAAGVIVGRVREVSILSETFEAVLKMELESKYAFPSDSSLRVMSSGLIGSQYIDVSPGMELESLEEESAKRLETTGDVYTVTNTQSAFVLEDLIGQIIFSMAEKAGSKE